MFLTFLYCSLIISVVEVILKGPEKVSALLKITWLVREGGVGVFTLGMEQQS